MSFRTAQLSLLAMFIGFLGLQEAVFLATFLSGKVYIDNLKTLSLEALTIYAVPLASILGGMFGKQKAAERRSDRGAFSAAVAVAGLWNLLLLAFSVLVAIQDSAPDGIKVLTE